MKKTANSKIETQKPKQDPKPTTVHKPSIKPTTKVAVPKDSVSTTSKLSNV